MSNYQFFNNGELEFIIDIETGESFASINGYSQMADKQKSTIWERIKKSTVRFSDENNAENLTVYDLETVRFLKAEINHPTRGLKTFTLIPGQTVTDWLIKDKPELLSAIVQAGWNKYVHFMVNFELESKNNQKIFDVVNQLNSRFNQQEEKLKQILNDKSKDELVGSVIKEEFSGLSLLIVNTIGEFEVHHLKSIEKYLSGSKYLTLFDVFILFFPELKYQKQILTKARYGIGKCYEELTKKKLPSEKGNYIFNRDTIAFALWKITNVAQKEGLLKESPKAIRQELEELYNF